MNHSGESAERLRSGWRRDHSEMRKLARPSRDKNGKDMPVRPIRPLSDQEFVPVRQFVRTSRGLYQDHLWLAGTDWLCGIADRFPHVLETLQDRCGAQLPKRLVSIKGLFSICCRVRFTRRTFPSRWRPPKACGARSTRRPDIHEPVSTTTYRIAHF